MKKALMATVAIIFLGAASCESNPSVKVRWVKNGRCIVVIDGQRDMDAKDNRSGVYCKVAPE
jgi:hypothetical protein